MFDKKFSVFVSSTFEDLREDRSKVISALREAGYIVIAMEHFDASDEPPIDYIREQIQECDYYVVMVGNRYGSEEVESGKSYTQLEYEVAKSQKIPCLAFLKGSTEETLVDIDAGKAERLRAFKGELSAGRLVRHYAKGADVGMIVHMALFQAQKKHPRPGWIRGDQVISNDYLVHIENLREDLARAETYARDLEALQDFDVENDFLMRLYTIRLGSGMLIDGSFSEARDTITYAYELLSHFPLFPSFLTLENAYEFIRQYTCQHSGCSIGAELDHTSADAFLFEALRNSVFLALIHDDGSYSLRPGRAYVRTIGLAKVKKAQTYQNSDAADISSY